MSHGKGNVSVSVIQKVEPISWSDSATAPRDEILIFDRGSPSVLA